jgi:NOL1/NOP2/sun family putative RNA methylase
LSRRGQQEQRSRRNQFLSRYRELGHPLTGDEQMRRALRVNILKTRDTVLIEKLHEHGAELEKVDFLSHGYFIGETSFSLGASFEYLLGHYCLQEAASQYAVEVLNPTQEDLVLDMCAAPGGKTTQIAAFMENRGRLIALDNNRRRLYALENNLERCGVKNCVAYHSDVREMDFKGLLFDKVLLDAPCSGNYAADPDWFLKRRLVDVRNNSEYQRTLLDAAIRLLRSGGVLLYSTCSLEPEENEVNVQWLLENHDITLEKVEGPGSPGLTEVFGSTLSPEIAKTMRLWPDEAGTQGFYVARLVKL